MLPAKIMVSIFTSSQFSATFFASKPVDILDIVPTKILESTYFDLFPANINYLGVSKAFTNASPALTEFETEMLAVPLEIFPNTIHTGELVLILFDKHH